MNTKHPVLDTLIEKIGNKRNYLKEQVEEYDHLKDLQNKNGDFFAEEINFCRICIRAYLFAMNDLKIIDSIPESAKFKITIRVQ